MKKNFLAKIKGVTNNSRDANAINNHTNMAVDEDVAPGISRPPFRQGFTVSDLISANFNPEQEQQLPSSVRHQKRKRSTSTSQPLQEMPPNPQTSSQMVDYEMTTSGDFRTQSIDMQVQQNISNQTQDQDLEQDPFCEMARVCELMLDNTFLEESLNDVRNKAYFQPEPGLAVDRNPPKRKCKVVPPENITELIRCINILMLMAHDEIILQAVNSMAQMVSTSSEVARIIIEMKALPILVKLLQSASQPIKEKALIILFYLAYYQSHAHCEKFLKTGFMYHLIILLESYKSKPHLTMLKFATHIAASICKGTRFIRDVVQLDDLIDVTIKILQHSKNNRLLEHSCMSLVYLSRGPSERIHMLVKSGVVIPLIELTIHKCDKVAWASILAIKNIFDADENYHANALVNCGLMPHFRQVLRLKPEILHFHLLGMIQKVTEIVNDQKIKLMMSAEIVPELIKKISRVPLIARFSDHALRGFERSLKVCKLITDFNDESQNQALINQGLLMHLKKVLFFCTPYWELCVEYSCSIIANITAGNRDQVQALIDTDIFPDLFRVFREINQLTTKTSIMTALELTINLGFIEQIDYLVQKKALQFLCELLSDELFILNALRSLDDILKIGHTALTNYPVSLQSESIGYIQIIQSCDGQKKLEDLLHHRNPEVAEIARYLYEENFIRSPERVEN